MTIIAFPQSRRDDRPSADGRRLWDQAEMQELLALSSFLSSRAEAGCLGATWEIGTTEDGDPQFYQLGATPDDPCVLCISRIGRLYVLEDGNGGMIAEGPQLKPLIERASRALVRRNVSAFVMRSLFALYTFRLTVEQKLEPFLAESTENWNRIAPQIATLI